jgi:hypothetical protein
LYFRADDLVERLPKYAAYRTEQEEKAFAEYQAEMEQYMNDQEAA